MTIKYCYKLFIACLVLTLVGCASQAKITYAWTADSIDEYRGGEGVLVLAISKKPEVRARFEDAFTHALKREGVHAVPSHTLNDAREITRDDVMAMAKQAKLDYTLITSFAGRDEYEVLHPGRTYYAVQPIYTGTGGYYGRGGVYGAPFEVAHIPDFYAQHKSVHLEANLYALPSGEHMWQAASGIEESSDNKAMVESFIHAYIAQLKKDLGRS